MPNPKRFTSNAVTTAANGVAIVVMFFLMMIRNTPGQQIRETLEHEPLQFFAGRCGRAFILALISALCVSLIKILFRNLRWDHQQKTVKQLVLRTLYFFLAAGTVSVFYSYYYLYYVVLA